LQEFFPLLPCLSFFGFHGNLFGDNLNPGSKILLGQSNHSRQIIK